MESVLQSSYAFYSKMAACASVRRHVMGFQLSDPPSQGTGLVNLYFFRNGSPVKMKKTPEF